MEPDNYKDIAERLSKDKFLDKDMVNSILLDTFSTLKTKMTSFDNLRFSIKGLVIFYYRKLKILKALDKANNVLIGDNINCDLYGYEDAQVLTDKLTPLKQKYEEFLEEKRKYKKIRDGIITLDKE